jgi:hypothetical protein
MNLKRTLFESFPPIVESVIANFDTVVYHSGITPDKHEIFYKMPFFGINPPSNACLFSYITLPFTYDNMLITNPYLVTKKGEFSIHDVKTFLEYQFRDTVYIILPFRYTTSGVEISSEIHKIKMMYGTLINFSY